MLVITRKAGERLLIGDDIVVTVVEVRSDNSIRIGIDAPRSIRVLRQEIAEAVAAENLAATSANDGAGSELAGLLQRTERPTAEAE